MNQLSTIAEAARVALAAAAAAGTFTPLAPDTVERLFVPPEYESAATTQLRLLVIGLAENVDLWGTNTTRTLCDHVYDLRVAILKRVAAADVTSTAANAELDRLSDFREQLIDFLKGTRVMGNGQLDTLVNDPAAYNPATLDQKKTFVSVITAKYRVLR